MIIVMAVLLRSIAAKATASSPDGIKLAAVTETSVDVYDLSNGAKVRGFGYSVLLLQPRHEHSAVDLNEETPTVGGWQRGMQTVTDSTRSQFPLCRGSSQHSSKTALVAPCTCETLGYGSGGAAAGP